MQNDSLRVKWLFAIKKIKNKSALPSFYMLSTGQKHNRKKKEKKRQERKVSEKH